MKRKTGITLALFGIITGLMLQPAMAKKGKGGGKPAPVPVLTDIEAADLLFMREEEKLARDVYITLYAEWGVRVFDNISQSEQTHMDKILDLLVKYGLDDPALGFGEFADGELQELFDMLIADGLQSKLDALMVGALIEEVDMEDIVDAMERTDEADILTVYGNLLAGSENHLNSFVKNIEAITGEAYVAQWISQEEVDAILGR
ncbi:MAG: ferritin [Verrucomicrobia bacterium]|nr:MAG: ferritin [Verrucomicrobiota bacterium]